MADSDINMRDSDAGLAAPAGVGDDASNQEIAQNTVDQQPISQQLTPEAICAATDNPSLQEMLFGIGSTLDELPAMLQYAHASQEAVEESSDRFKIAARVQQTFAASMEEHVKQREQMIKDMMQFMEECKATMDDAIKAKTKVESLHKQIINLENRVAELEMERKADKEMPMPTIPKKPQPVRRSPHFDADRRVNQVRVRLANVSLEGGNDDSIHN